MRELAEKILELRITVQKAKYSDKRCNIKPMELLSKYEELKSESSMLKEITEETPSDDLLIKVVLLDIEERIFNEG